MNYTKYNPRCYTGTEWSGGDDGDSDGDDDDDPDEVRRDDDDDGDDFPSPGGNFPGRISLPESFFSLDGFRPVEAAVFFVDDPP